MERLTTRNIAGIAVFKESYNCERCGEGLWRLPDYGNGSPTDKLAEYEDLEEQGLLLRLPVTVNDVVDKLFSHNELISLWKVEEDGLEWFHKRIWHGMAWNIPKELKQCQFVKIFGTIPESIVNADIINVEVLLSEEAEAALEKMKGEEHD